MNAANLFYYTATGCFLIMVILAIYTAWKLVQTLEELQLFLKEIREISIDVHKVPQKVQSGFLGMAAKILQFFLK